MAVYTVLRRKTLEALTKAYGLGELSAFSGVPTGAVNTYYHLESSKGKFFLVSYNLTRNNLRVKTYQNNLSYVWTLTRYHEDV